MKKFSIAAISAVSLILLAAQSGIAQQDPDAVLRIQDPVPTRLAIADFVPRMAATGDTESALQVFNRTLFDDLKFSGFFEIPSRSFYPLKPLRNPSDVAFENWQVPPLEVDFLAFGTIQVDATATVVEAFLYDVKTKQQVLAKRYTLNDRTLIRNAAHLFSDQVVTQLSAGASRGVAQTQIAFASRKGDSKEIYVMDYDGANVRTITANGGLNKFPDWISNNSGLAFITKLPTANRWQLWIQNLLEGGHRIFPVEGSFVSSPATQTDGNRIAFAARSRSRGDSDIFVASLDGANLRNLTNHPSIDTAPTWSPAGNQIAFISDRSGSPQLWAMDADGSNVVRLVREGGHCDSPDWSPDGQFIAYSWQAPKQWQHDIYVVEVATGKIFQLTRGGGSKESPHWSPDGRHIAFQSTRSGSKQIFIMNRNGENLKQITAYGINEGPSWSYYPDSRTDN